MLLKAPVGCPSASSDKLGIMNDDKVQKKGKLSQLCLRKADLIPSPQFLSLRLRSTVCVSAAFSA